MMLSRRCPSAACWSRKKPASSGPRCWMVLVMRRRIESAPEGGSTLTNPAIPHMLQCTGKRGSLSWAESCLIQEEPEAGVGFSHKMSLKEKLGMLGIDSPHGRHQSDEPGADPGVSERQWGGRISGREQSRGVRLDRADAAASGLRPTGTGRQRSGEAIPEQADGLRARAADASDRALCRARIGAGDAVSAAQV